MSEPAFTPPADAPKFKRLFVYSPLARIAIFALLTAAMFAVVAFALRLAGHDRIHGLGDFMARAVPISVIAYLLLTRGIEARWPAELHGRKALPHLLAGTAGGIALVLLVIGVLWLAGSYRITGTRDDVDWFSAVLLAGVGAAVFEEIVFRGVLFRIVEEGLGKGWALCLTALLFGAAHIGNPGATVWTSAAIAVEAGILLGVVYHVTRSLWACMGVHFGWNFFEGAIVGSPVSGVAAKGWLVAEFPGPAWLTGGSFGIEASVVTVAACLGASALLLLLRGRRPSGAALPLSAGAAPC